MAGFHSGDDGDDVDDDVDDDLDDDDDHGQTFIRKTSTVNGGPLSTSRLPIFYMIHIYESLMKKIYLSGKKSFVIPQK